MKYTMRSIVVMLMLLGSVQVLPATKKQPSFIEEYKSTDGKYQIGYEASMKESKGSQLFDVNVWRSDDSGKTWELLSGKRKSGLPVFRVKWGMFLATDMSRKDNIGKYQAMVVGGDHFYVSQDFGKTWKKKGPKAEWGGVGVWDDGKEQFVSYITAYADHIIFKSNDYGKTWKKSISPLKQ